jgi:hypothetical protein
LHLAAICSHFILVFKDEGFKTDNLTFKKASQEIKMHSLAAYYTTVGVVICNAEDFLVWFLVHCLSQSNHSIFVAIDTPSEVFPNPKARSVTHPLT